MEDYCKGCSDAAALRKIFDETVKSFFKPLDKAKYVRTKYNGSYEMWTELKPQDELAKSWELLYEAIRDSEAGLKFYNNYKLLKSSPYIYHEDGDGI